MRVGADFMLASAACGVIEKTAQEWLAMAENSKDGDPESDIYCKLYNGIRQSTAHAEVIALQRLSAEGGSTGAKWLLEKINPENTRALKQFSLKRSLPLLGFWKNFNGLAYFFSIFNGVFRALAFFTSKKGQQYIASVNYFFVAL